MKQLLLTVFALLVIVPIARSQDEQWREINSVTEWIEEINNWPDSLYRQNYLRIKFDYAKDSSIIATSWDEVEKYRETPGEQLVINKRVNVWAIEFEGERKENSYAGWWLVNLHFKEPFSMYRLENDRFGFINCHFGKLYQPRLMKTRFYLRHYNCQFDGFVNINNPISPTPIAFEDCIMGTVLNISAIDAIPSLSIVNCDIPYLSISNKMSTIRIDSSRFPVGFNMSRLNIETSIDIYSSSIGSLGLMGTQLPSANTYIPFDNLRNKIGLFWGDDFWRIIEATRDDYKNLPVDSLLSLVYRGNSEEELQHKEAFDQLIASYYKLITIYKLRGEADSYKAAYIEMRDKMTARSKLFYKQNPSFDRYFDWQINRFTKAFSDYGTHPAKALLIFFQVVLAFSIFYFFFPSSWNTTNSAKLMKRLAYLGSYFKSDEGLSELFEKQTREEYHDYEEFKAFMNTSQKELPIYFTWLSKPLYKLSTSRFNITRSVLRKSDILNGKWSELPPPKKATTSIIIGLYLLLYLTYVLFIRCLNAVALSLNSFSTLGFGEIPTKGMARYITIMQGFIGWFLLSIFLVSLIGQILN